MSSAPQHGLSAALAAKREATKAQFDDKVARLTAGIKTKSLEDTFAADSGESGTGKAPAGLPNKYGLITAAELAKDVSQADGGSQQLATQTAAKEGSTATVRKARAMKRKRQKLSFTHGASDSDSEDNPLALRKKRKRKRAQPESATESQSTKASAGTASIDTAGGRTDAQPSKYVVDRSSASTSAAHAPTRDASSDVSFLLQHDADRKAQEIKKALEAEWMERETRLKRSKITVTYSYWDGSGHRRQIKVPRGATIGRFLEWVRQDLSAEFPELAKISADGLLYVKEDLILPHSCDFHSLIETKARGKSGPLFVFEVVEDVRLSTDHREEAAPVESHPGKVVERRWYEANKHVFPASRWELFDAQQAHRDGPYTTHGDEVRGKRAKEGAGAGAASGATT